MRHHFLAGIVVLGVRVIKARSGPDLHDEAEVAVQAISVSFIDDLDVTLVFQLTKLVSCKPHKCSSFMSIEVDEEGVGDI